MNPLHGRRDDDVQLHVLLWSRQQNALHIEPLEDMLAQNRRAYTDDVHAGDFVPLLIAPRSELDGISASMTDTLKKRNDMSRLPTSKNVEQWLDALERGKAIR